MLSHPFQVLAIGLRNHEGVIWKLGAKGAFQAAAKTENLIADAETVAKVLSIPEFTFLLSCSLLRKGRPSKPKGPLTAQKNLTTQKNA